MMQITVCICTHNRADLLRDCLEGVASQDELGAAEIVVVANNCSDRTPEVVESFKGRIPNLTLLDEPTPGAPVARNRALAHASTKYVAFIDDDTIPQPGWLSATIDALVRTGASGVGGKVVPYWKGKRPWWISDRYYPLLGSVDFGDGVFTPEEFMPTGANMAWQTDLLRGVGGFDPRFGIRTEGGREVNKYRGDDAYIARKVLEKGGRLVYTGRSSVLHLTRGQTVSFSRELTRARQKGRSMGAMEGFDLSASEDDFVWALACGVSCLLRLHVRDAIIFSVIAVLKKSSIREFHETSGVRFSLWQCTLRAAKRSHRGLLGLLKRTLIGRSVIPELQKKPEAVTAK